MRTRTQPLWPQVGGLGALQAAITLLWVLYTLYLPQLLSQVGLPPAVGTTLLLIENLLAIALEPLMGMLSDRQRQWLGSRLPLISSGVILATLLMLSLPAIAAAGGTAFTRRLLPAALVAWAVAMSLVRSPALSLLGRYAQPEQLPQAASLITLLGTIAGASSTFAQRFLLSLGAGVAFALGSLLLLLSALVLRAFDPLAPAGEPAPAPLAAPTLGRIVGAGLGISLTSNLIRQLLAPTSLLLVLFSVAQILSILPAGWVATRWSNRTAMLGGLGGWVLAIGLLRVAAPLSAVLLGVAASLVVNGALPFALTQVPPTRAGLATGLYFAGGAIASSAVTALAPPAEWFVLMALGGLLLAAVCLQAQRSPWC